MKINATFGFEFICWIATISLCIFWIYKYSLNEDLCSVDFKNYFKSEEDVFPMLSLCLQSPISQKKLKTVMPEIDPSLYTKFIQGEEFNSSWLNIDYQRVIKNISEYIEQDGVGFRNGSRLWFHPNYENSSEFFYQRHADYQIRIANVSSLAVFYDERFYNCYGLSVPHDRNIEFFYFLANSNIFPSGFRPAKYSLMAILHYPNQMLYSSKMVKYAWPQDRQQQDIYAMRFKMRKVEVLRRRQKRGIGCNENWKEYDSMVIKSHINKIGCRPVYIDSSFQGPNIPNCSTKEEMHKARFTVRTDGYGIPPPCTSMEEISYEYEESTFSPNDMDIVKEGTFWIGIFYPNPYFKDIYQTRAINEQALVGNIGGYLGLFMGYSILQLPNILQVLVTKLKKWYLQLKIKAHSKEDALFKIDAKEVSSSTNDESFGRNAQMKNFGCNVQPALTEMKEKIEFLQERLLKLEEKLQYD